MTNKGIKRLTPAVARLDRPRKPTKTQRLREHRQIKAWQEHTRRPAPHNQKETPQ